VLGVDRGRLVEELVRQSDLHVIAVDDDPAKAAALRERFHNAGLYGSRVSVLVGDPITYPFPPYFADLVVTETPDALEQGEERQLAEAVFHTLRPYGGVACAWGSLADRHRIEQLVRDAAFPGAEVRQVDQWVLLARTGPLPGAADWSHAEANAASTGASEDDFIRGPMSLLWFDASQRWHRQPGHLEVRVSGGRLLVLETGLLRATDVYTGRVLWESDLSVGLVPITEPDERQQIHRWPSRPRSLAPSTELVAVEDAIYLSEGARCLVLDPATGQSTAAIDLPEDMDSPWSNLRVDGDYLIGSSGRHVLCVHRHSGKLVWRHEAGRAALSLAVGGGKVFCAELADCGAVKTRLETAAWSRWIWRPANESGSGRVVHGCGTAQRWIFWSRRSGSIGAPMASLGPRPPAIRRRGSWSRGGDCPKRDCRATWRGPGC
jgi:hypothetical protein